MSTISVGLAKSSPDCLNSILEVVRKDELKTGDRLPSIRQLAERLDLNQSAVRHALLKAETMGLVKVVPRAGVFLRSVPTSEAAPPINSDILSSAFQSIISRDDQNLFHLLDARRVIDIELAGRAAGRRRLEDLLPVRRTLQSMLELPLDASRVEYVNYDIRFHTEIARLADSDVLFAIHRSLMEMLRDDLIDAPWGPQRRTSADQSHAAIYEALVAGDADKTREAVHLHLSLAYDCMLHNLKEVPTVDRCGHPKDAGFEINQRKP